MPDQYTLIGLILIKNYAAVYQFQKQYVNWVF